MGDTNAPPGEFAGDRARAHAARNRGIPSANTWRLTLRGELARARGVGAFLKRPTTRDWSGWSPELPPPPAGYVRFRGAASRLSEVFRAPRDRCRYRVRGKKGAAGESGAAFSHAFGYPGLVALSAHRYPREDGCLAAPTSGRRCSGRCAQYLPPGAEGETGWRDGKNRREQAPPRIPISAPLSPTSGSRKGL